jgi:tetratricopeptide (TPR) repeat protein
VTEGEGDEIVDAQTVVPPSVRLVPRAGDREDSVEAFLEKSEDVISIPLARPGSAAPSAPARAPAPAAPADPLGWEEELESLNLKSGEDEIVGRRGLKSATAAAPAGGDMDLAELLGDPIGSLSDDPVPAPEPAASAETPAEPPPAAPSSFEEPAMDPVVAEEHVAVRRAFTRPSVARSRARELAPAAPARQRSSVSPTMFAMLGVVILAGAAAVWWFVYQPRIAAAQAAAPPAGDPPAGSADRGPGSGPIPTPLGSTSRQPAEPAASGAEVAAAVPEEAPADARVAPAGPGSDDAGSAGSAEPAPARPRPSAEALRREAVQHMSDGRRLMAAGKWQEARTALAAALALDPVNFECKELLDRVQVKVDEEVKVTRDLDEARRAFADKDYQAALWKLYRLPRDPRLGDIERYIRNAWYNWAVVGLKGGDATDARQKLAEVLSADPGDEDAQKLLDVAERYSSRAKDRVYYSFADNLKLRAFDQE